MGNGLIPKHDLGMRPFCNVHKLLLTNPFSNISRSHFKNAAIKHAQFVSISLLSSVIAPSAEGVWSRILK